MQLEVPKTYFCVASSNKTGRMVAEVHEILAYRLPSSKYYPAMELYLDYFDTRYMANKFATNLEK